MSIKKWAISRTIKVKENTVLLVSASFFAITLLALTFYISNDRVCESETNVMRTTLDNVVDSLDGPLMIPVRGSLWKPLLVDNRETSSVLVLAFLAYECPFSDRLYDGTIKSLIERYVDEERVSFAVVNFPQRFHPQSNNAAKAAECVLSIEGKKRFLDYIEQLYDEDISRYTHVQYIQLASFDEIIQKRVSDCINSNPSVIGMDIEKALNFGVNTTPTVLVGIVNDEGEIKGEMLTGSYPIEEYEYLIDNYIK